MEDLNHYKCLVFMHFLLVESSSLLSQCLLKFGGKRKLKNVQLTLKQNLGSKISVLFVKERGSSYTSVNLQVHPLVFYFLQLFYFLDKIYFVSRSFPFFQEFPQCNSTETGYFNQSAKDCYTVKRPSIYFTHSRSRYVVFRQGVQETGSF